MKYSILEYSTSEKFWNKYNNLLNRRLENQFVIKNVDDISHELDRQMFGVYLRIYDEFRLKDDEI